MNSLAHSPLQRETSSYPKGKDASLLDEQTILRELTINSSLSNWTSRPERAVIKKTRLYRPGDPRRAWLVLSACNRSLHTAGFRTRFIIPYYIMSCKIC